METFKLADTSNWGEIRSRDGTRLFYRQWTPVSSARGTILLIPGLGEHSGRYLHVGEFFRDAGFTVLAIDIRGHGRSGGARAYVKQYDDFLDDIRAAIGLVKVQPLIVFGHSLGGEIALALAREKESNVAGYIVSAPWLALTSPPATWMVRVASLLNIVYPECRFATGIKQGETSSDLRHLDSLADLDLNTKFITVRAFFEITARANRLLNDPQANAPVLIAHGKPDPVTSGDATIAFFRELEAPAKELKIYDGFLHELHNEADRLRVLNDYLDWIERVVLIGSTRTEFLVRAGGRKNS